MRRLGSTALLLTGLALVPASAGYAGEPTPSPHPLHLSYTRMVLEGNYVILNVRMFTDDLENALSRFHGIEGLRMRPEPIVDSLFSSYYNTAFILTIGDSVLRGAIAGSGQAEDMWYYNIVYEAPTAVIEISFQNDLLFDLFDDQRNITRVLYAPTERHRTYYSVASHPETHRFSIR